MKIHTDLVKHSIKNPIVTIGVFDGLHKGHQMILSQLKDLARKHGGETVVITLWPHPRYVLGSAGPDTKLLTTLEEKQWLLSKSGIDHLVIFPFTRSFAKQTYKDFLKQYLLRRIGIHTLVVGENNAFGKDREGSFPQLVELGKKFGFQVQKTNSYKLEEGDVISSTFTREAIENGEMELANNSLGYAYFLTGYTVKGNQLGRKIGFPTANLNLNSSVKLIPKDGVYAVMATLGNGNLYKGMLNIGIRPTIEEQGKQKHLEVHLFDFNADLYEEKLTLFFISRIREEHKFNSLEELSDQLKNDKNKALDILQMYNENHDFLAGFMNS